MYIITVYLTTTPEQCYVRSKATRFRWIQTGGRLDSDNSWALTHVYIGDECDWTCAGHGRCHHATCMLVHAATTVYWCLVLLIVIIQSISLLFQA